MADPTEECWKAIQEEDIGTFGASIKAVLEAQVAMFPNIMNDSVASLIKKYRHLAVGWKLSGAGGGGYLVVVSETPVENASRIYAR